MASTLVLTASTHQKLKTHLFPGDGLESAAILLCHLGRGIRGVRLMVSEMVLVPAHECTKRSRGRVIWPFAAYMDADRITQIDTDELCIVTIHSHPEGADQFSPIDNNNDRVLFSSVCGWFDDDRPNGSAIMLPDGSMVARTCNGNRFTAIDTVCVAGDDIQLWKHNNKRAEIPDYATRIAQTFGKGTLNLLRQMKVGVIGCSGTGSVIVELLARNCVGNLVLVDPDVVEKKNLNRIVNARNNDADQASPKAKVLKKAVEAMGTGVTVDACYADTYGNQVLEKLIECDALFGCVDSALGRYHLDCMASAYLIPYFDVGVGLVADRDGSISQADATAHYVHPESPGLLDRGVYTSEQVTAEGWKRDNEAYYEQQKTAGYLQGVAEDQPAVLSVNMQAACLAFNDFLARIHRFRLDQNVEFTAQVMQLVQGCYLSNELLPVKSSIFRKYMGMGDKSLLIRNLKKSRE